MTREAILKEALQLPPQERTDLAADLLESVDAELVEAPEEIEKAWAEEIERRARRVLFGEAPGRS